MRLILNIPQQDYPFFMDWLLQFPNYPQIKIEESEEIEEVSEITVLASIKNAAEDMLLHEAGITKFKPIAELLNEL